MEGFVKAAKLSELPAGQGKVVQVGVREVALFNVNGAIHAIDNECPHQGGPLGEGTLEGKHVTCPWHGWKFDVTTGANPVLPSKRVPTFEVKVDGDDIFVKV